MKKPEFTIVAQGKNKAGKLFAIWKENKTGRFWVWARCANYNGRVHGAISYSWRYCERDLDETAARALFERKLKGKEKRGALPRASLA